MITHIHQRNKLVDGPICRYDCLDNMGWKDGPFAEKVHRSFLKDFSSGHIGKWHSSFNIWSCDYFERVSINAVSWLGSDMMNEWNNIGVEEEIALSSDLPSKLGRPNEIFGGAIAAHLAFWPQRKHIDGTDILSLYREISRNYSA